MQSLASIYMKYLYDGTISSTSCHYVVAQNLPKIYMQAVKKFLISEITLQNMYFSTARVGFEICYDTSNIVKVCISTGCTQKIATQTSIQ